MKKMTALAPIQVAEIVEDGMTVASSRFVRSAIPEALTGAGE